MISLSLGRRRVTTGLSQIEHCEGENFYATTDRTGTAGDCPFIEADRPLPEKYRFLLIEDKREVELVWNGKKSEFCNIVLPFQVIEQVDEPRAGAEQDRREGGGHLRQ